MRKAVLGIVVLVFMGSSVPATIPNWANQCGDGRLDLTIDAFETAAWTYCCSDLGVARPTLSSVSGCSGNAMAVDFDLTGDNWFVFLKNLSTPLDLRAYTHLRIALRSSNVNTHHNFEIKLYDGRNLYAVLLRSVTDLPVWRPVYLDLREFTCGNCSQPIDLSSIVRIEAAVVRCQSECEVSSGTIQNSDRAVFYLDELGAVNLLPGAPRRLVQTAFEQITANPDLRASTAQALLNHQRTDGLAPAWFPETTPNLNTYSNATALIVFVDEFERTLNAAFSAAARKLGSALLQLQIPAGRVNAGAWFTAYDPNLQSRDHCTGDEVAIPARDTCFWIGNTAWAAIALEHLKRSGIYADNAAIDSALAKAGSWMAGQIGRNPSYPNLISEGVEGNLSAYFGFIAAGRASEAARVADSLATLAWDPVQRRMRIGATPSDYTLALDTAGSWGAIFLRALGRDQDALMSQAFAATVLRTSSFSASNAAGQSLDGYSDIGGPWTMTVEFGAQAASAGILDANLVMGQIYPLQAGDGTFPGSTDNWYGGTIPPWVTTWTGTAPTAWVYFAQNGDPLLNLVSPGINDPAKSSSTVSQTVFPANERSATVTIRGRNFGAASQVFAGTTALQATFVSDSQLDVVVPASLTGSFGSFKLTVTNPGQLVSNSVSINVIERGDVNAGRTVNIGDALFTALNVGGLNRPPLANSVGDINLSGTTNIGDALAIALFTGRLTANFATPDIVSADPGPMVRGAAATITGTGFSSNAGDHQVVFSTAGGGISRVTPSASAAGESGQRVLTLTVPADATSGPIQVLRSDLLLGSAEYPVLVTGTPTPLLLTSVSPFHRVNAGDSITLRGLGFDSTASNNLVQFRSSSGMVAGTVTAATTTMLTVRVPEGALCGPVTVSTGGQTSVGRTVLVSGPACPLILTDVLGGGAGDVLLIEGAGFDVVTPSNNVVRFKTQTGTVTARVLQAGGTQLLVRIPDAAVYGDVTVSVGDQTSNALLYRKSFTDNFETSTSWVINEELVTACYGNGIGEVAASTDIGLQGSRSLRVWSNKSLSTKSNHVIGGFKVSDKPRSGRQRYKLSALIAADTAETGQTGPEFSMQSTKEISAGQFRTSTAGIQYISSPFLPTNRWMIWAEDTPGSPGVAKWIPVSQQPPALTAGQWYEFILEADYDTNRYRWLSIQAPGQAPVVYDLSMVPIAKETKPGFNEEAFWITLESENLYNNCGTAGAFQYKVYYDNVELNAPRFGRPE